MKLLVFKFDGEGFTFTNSYIYEIINEDNDPRFGEDGNPVRAHINIDKDVHELITNPKYINEQLEKYTYLNKITRDDKTHIIKVNNRRILVRRIGCSPLFIYKRYMYSFTKKRYMYSFTADACFTYVSNCKNLRKLLNDIGYEDDPDSIVKDITDTLVKYKLPLYKHLKIGD